MIEQLEESQTQVDQRQETPDSGTKVAIIMRSKDEQPYAESALAALATQSYGAYTLYNVDSGSKDGTLEAVKAFNPDPALVFEIKPEEYVPGPVLNMMVARTTEPVVVFLNADAIPQSDTWLETLLAPIFNGEADATVSKQVPRDCARFIDKYDFERAYYSARTVEKSPEFFSAVACAFRRELWEETKFCDQGYAEDIAWSKVCQEKGARFQLVLESVVEHSHNYSMKGLYRKRYRHGVAYVTIYDAEPNALRQFYLCGKELVRDMIYTLRKFRLDTIPYNIAHRVIIHLAYYRGERDERRRRNQLKSSNA